MRRERKGEDPANWASVSNDDEAEKLDSPNGSRNCMVERDLDGPEWKASNGGNDVWDEYSGV